MRKVVTKLAMPAFVACLLTPVHPAHAADSIGGARLAGRGYVWDRSSGEAEPPHIQASSYVIADLETGAVLAAKDPHGHYRPASTLKTLTSITLIPRLDPAKKVRPSLNAVNISGSAVGMDVKWTYTVKDLFHGLLMQSGNDAAIALAEANGGLPATLAAMNAEARRIQALDTVARTPNGLDDDPPLTLAQQHSSAYDLALIMKQGLTLPDFRTYVGAKLYDWPAPPTKEERKKGKKTGGYEIGTHDHLLIGNHYPGMIGGKNGWTSHALGSFVGAATRGGHTIVIALMHAQSDFWGDARSLLDWGFAERAKATPVGTLVNPIPPPAKPKPKAKTAAQPAPAADRERSGGLAWWNLGLPAAVAFALIGGIVIGLRRRRVADTGSPAPDGPFVPAEALRFAPPDDSAEETRADTPPRRLPPGDVKVAGSPLSPGGPSRPPSWATVPSPVPSDAEQTTAPEPEPEATATDQDTGGPHRDAGGEVTVREWTVRLPDGATAPSGPAEFPPGAEEFPPGAEDDTPPGPWSLTRPLASEEPDDHQERGPFDPPDRTGLGGPPEHFGNGETTVRDERHGEEQR